MVKKNVSGFNVGKELPIVLLSKPFLVYVSLKWSLFFQPTLVPALSQIVLHWSN